ncbi:uncharacterized protein LOC123511189 isoform X2 [Portunus trituberculatus]|nr:uncharacterized protein LOC123511189 isoform X2 [Portunus trituberculatus]
MRAAAVTEINSLGYSADQRPTSEADHRREVHSRGFPEVWRQSRAKCRVIVMDNVIANATLINEFLSWAMLWRQPETRLVFVGRVQDMDVFLDHSHNALRNTRHAVFVALPLNDPGAAATGNTRNGVEIYQRCLYCNRSRAGVQRLQHHGKYSVMAERQALLPEHHEHREDFRGHRFKVVAMEYFPYISYERLQGDKNPTLRLRDSLNTRMITVLAQHLNFTYEVMEPEDCQWGLEASGGNWTGIVGTLQHEKADFSMDLTLTSERATAVNFCRVYIDENMVILSSKPRPPPEYLSLIKPFEGIVWLIVVVSVMVWGVMLWCLLRIRNRVSQGSSMDIASSLFYGWGLLLEDRPYEPPANLTGQTMGPEEGMRKVLAGDFSYIHNYYVMRILLATHQQGAATIPVHISTTKYPLFPGNTWAFRPGSPFITRFNEGIQRLLDAGLIDFWMEDVIFTNVTKRRIQEKGSEGKINLSNANSHSQVVLGLLHLQVTFYLLFIGHTAAAFVFLTEHALARR